MAFMLYTTENPIDREQRRRINLNWEMITNRFSNLQGQVSVLAGGEDVEKLIIRINDSIDGAVKAKEDADKATADARTAIDDINSSKAETEAATIAANEATTRANEASEAVQLQINELNEKLPQLTQQLQDGNDLKVALESLQLDLTTLQMDLNTAKENTEKATADAIDAYNQIKGWTAATVWSNAVPYEKNNVVTFNGSTWQATTPNVNSQPSVDNPDWLVLARAGLDGLGSVVTVNNQAPDMNGNVQITKGDIELGNVENYLIATKEEAEEGISDEAYMTPLRTKQAIDVDLKQITDELAIKDIEMVNGDNIVQTKIKSPVNVLRIDGKTIVNLAPLFDSGAWTTTTRGAFTIVDPTTIKQTSTGETANFNIVTVPAKANTVYSATLGKSSVQDLRFIVRLVKADGTESEQLNPNDTGIGGARTITGTTKADTTALRIYVYPNPTTVSEATFGDISLVEGTQVQPFVANVKGLTNPTIVNETNGTSLVVPTTLYDGEYVEQNANGELVKHKKWQEKMLDDSLTWAVTNQPTGFKQIRTPYTGGIPASATIVKFNGVIIPQGSTLIAPDLNTLSSDGNLYLSIPNTDSGWGDNYTPTPEEIKAYFLGWYMSNQGSKRTPYSPNGSGEKQWYPISRIRDTFSESYWKISIPTETADNKDGWQPYRLIYELATPVQEVIEPYSDLTLEKGENSVRVYSGRIVNELNKPTIPTGVPTTYINHKDKVSTLLKYRTNKLLNVYQNNIKVNQEWSFYYDNANGYGGSLIGRRNLDLTASYTVDYEPLYTWEVTAPIDSVQLQYFETLQAVTNELVYGVAKQQDTVKRMLENVVNKEEGLVYIKPTLSNGLGFLAGAHLNSYYKDASGEVSINLFLEGVPTTSGTLVFRLPQGYRPKGSITFPTFHYEGSGGLTSGITTIFENGEVVFQNGEAVNRQYHVLNVSFKAEN